MTQLHRIIKFLYDDHGWVGHIINSFCLSIVLLTIYWWVRPWKVAEFGLTTIEFVVAFLSVFTTLGGMLVIPPFIQSFRSSDVRKEWLAQKILTFGTSIGAGFYLATFLVFITDKKPDLYLVLALVLGFAVSALSVAMSFWYISAASRAFQKATDQFANFGVRLPTYGLAGRELSTRRLHELFYDLQKAWLFSAPNVSQDARDVEVKIAIAAVGAEFGDEAREKIEQGLWSNYLSYTLRQPMPLTPDGTAITARQDRLIEQNAAIIALLERGAPQRREIFVYHIESGIDY